MKLVLPLMLMALFILFANDLTAQTPQNIPVGPKVIQSVPLKGISQPLGKIPALSKEEIQQMAEKAKRRAKNTPWPAPSYPFASSALPKGPDQAVQNFNGNNPVAPMAPIVNVDGQSSPYYPPDCNGVAGTDYYMQTVNTTYAIYNKSGTLVAGPTAMNSLFGNVPGATYNDGDPIILYDEQAGRWVAVEFSISGTNDYMLFAVSTTSNPTGTWYQYSFDVVDMPDYEKVAVWRDGYYMGTNTQPTTGNDIYVFERSQMLIGGTAQMVAFDNPFRPGTGVVTVPPVDNDGAFAPAGSPGTFIAFNDDAVGGGADELWIFELSVNWTTPGASTFARTQQLSVTPFDSKFNTTSSWEDIDQPGTTRNLCAISTVIMNVPQYRNFGTYQTIVCCHTVDVDNTMHAGIRWYELRKIPPATTWTVRQQSTYAPDAHSRWMGAISMNGSGKIAVGYSISSSTLYPGIRYAGQSSASNASATGILDIPEETVLTGANYQSSYNRWGDYASMCVDPTNDQTFWFTTEYIGGSEARKTKIISFNLGSPPVLTTLDATAITGSIATMNGTVNPNGLATTYHFEWGVTTAYGNNTSTLSAGSGTSNVSESAGISSLTAGTTYHFRIAGVNSDGTNYGNDLTFVAGGATVTTTSASSITGTTATAGGNVMSDGGSTVTARGTCWGTTANPVITGSHTSDASGLGSFTSSLTGLTPGTTYHIRAYATNGTSTVYGSDLTFTTICSTITSLPFNESFVNSGVIPNCWSQVDNIGNGQIWQFGTITGQSPNPALNVYYAYLNSDAYGSGYSQNADLITPTLNLSPYSAVTLQFNHYFKAYSTSSGKLYYSINNGSSWTLITTFSTTSATNPTAFSQAISAVAGQAQVKFKWNYTGTWGYYWAFDDVQVTGTCASILPVSVSVASSANPSCVGNSVTFTATPTNGGTPSYQWYKNSVAVGTGSTYTYIPANGDQVKVIMTTSLPCTSGSPATSNTVTMIVNPILPVSVSISPSANNICAGTSVTFTPTPTNGGTPTYQWYKNSVAAGSGSTYSYIPTNGDQVYVVMTSSLLCKSGSPATSNTVTMAVNPVLPVSVSLAADFTTVCAGTTVHFTATPTNGGSSPVYAWYKNTVLVPGVTGVTYSYLPANGDQVYVKLTSSETCKSGSPATSSTINMTVNPVLPVSVSLAADFTTVCPGTAVNFTATPTNGGSSPVYAWYKNTVLVPGATGATYSYIPTNGDLVYVMLTSNETCKSGSPATSSTINIIVNPILPVSVTLAADFTTVCAGTTVHFTATPTNGGSSPVYAWYKNTVLVPGVTGVTYSYLPANGDQVYVKLTSSETCKSGSPATSSTITMTVNPVLPVSVALAADFTTVCSGTTVNFTATPTNGGSSPVYAWYKNTVIVPGVIGATYSYVPANGDQVNVKLTSSEICKSGSPATSGIVTLTVNPILPVSVSLAADFTSVCVGSTVHFTATPANGGISPVYTWYKNTVLVPGVTGATYSYSPTNGDQVYVMLTSSETCKSGSPATSGTVTLNVNPILPVSVSLAADFTNVCSGTTVHFTATPTNGGSSPVYTWYKNSTLVPGVTGATYSYVSANGDQVYVMLTSSETCKSGSPATSSTINITVNPVLPVSVLLDADFTTVCSGTAVNFTATPTNGGSSPVYTWYKNSTLVPGVTGATYSYVPANGDQVNVKLTSSEICKSGSPATSGIVTLTVNPILPVSVSLAADFTSVCVGSTVHFTATPANGGISPVYTWYKNTVLVPGVTGATYSYSPTNGDQVYVMLTSSETCKSGSPATSGTVTLNVNTILPVSVSLAADFTNVCAGTTVNFTATPTNGGSSPVYAWYKNTTLVPGVTGATYSYVPANGDQVYVILTSNETCKSGSPATSSTINIIVNPILPVSVSLAADFTTVCAGTAVNFTATPTNGGSSPVYAWYKNSTLVSGITGATYSYVPANGDQVYAMLTSSETCKSGSPATSSTIAMTVNPILPVSVSLDAEFTTVCSGTAVNLTATPTNGGSSPVYAWYKNYTLVSGVTGATYSYVPANGDQVYVMLTSNETCKSGSPATSSTITMTVNPVLLVSVSLDADFTTVCDGTTVNFTATPTNGGSSPVYAWYKNTVVVPGVTGTTYSYIPTNGDQVYVMLTSSETCKSGSPATSGTVTLIVNPVLPVSVSVEPSENPVLDGTSVTFTATATNGGSAPLFQWIVNGINVGTNSPSYSYIPVNNDEVSCTLVSNAVCASGNPATSGVITMVVNPLILTVNPSNMTVTSSEGITAFNVTSNTNWTVLSDQSWCTVDPSGSGNGTIHASYTENTSPDLRVANITVAIAGLTPVVVTLTQQGIPYKVLNIKLYLEGLYNISSGEMNPAQGSSGNQFGDGIADRVTVELHQAIYPYNITYNFTEVNLNTDGTLVINTIPVNIAGSYYIVIRHRNSIETWSSFPVSFDIPNPVSFDFSTAATQAFSNNMKLMGTVYAIWSGDVTQDGLVDGSDMSALFNANQPSVLTGYYPEDVNGDGIVNGFDMSLVFNNSQPPPVQVKKP